MPDVNGAVTVTVTGRGVSLPPTLRAYAQEKAARLGHFSAGVRRVDVVLGLEAKGKEAVAECKIHVRRGQPLVARAEARDGWVAVDRALAKSEQQLKRTKERRRDRRHGRGSAHEAV